MVVLIYKIDQNGNSTQSPAKPQKYIGILTPWAMDV